MKLSIFHTKSKDELLKDFQIDDRGLYHDEVKKRQLKYGLNQLHNNEIFWWDILVRQFKSPFIFLLLAAGVLAVLLGEVIDGIMIACFVLINSFLGFYQEFKSEETLKLLKKFIKTEVKVIRAGKEIEVESKDLVPGDIVLLEAGDMIPADMRIIEEVNFTVDESILTGESIAVKKTQNALSQDSKELSNICYSGTTVESGKAKGIVIATGNNTSLGKISQLTTETHKVSSYENGIARFSKFILYIIIITLVGIFFINLFIKGTQVDIPNLLIFSVALAVSVIPEALPVVITFSLSRGALQLAKNKVVVKRLSAIEDLGNIEVLCTDKTGTLTENTLTYNDTCIINSHPLLYAALATTLDTEINQSVHSFDRALLHSLSADDKKEFAQFARVQENPFDPVRKRNSMLVKKHNEYELIVRGAAEEILKLSINISDEQRQKINVWLHKEWGNRVIAIARKRVSKDADLVKEENRLEFLGLVSFVDPIKKTAYGAVKQAENLQIQIKVLTGDSKEVAGSVAHQIGLITDKTKVLTGLEFEALPSHKQHQAVKDYVVFARVSPQQKYKIIQLLQEKHEVGFLGDGINDAPALKIANVSLVVEGATDVAKDAADIILLKKSLQVIIEGITQGRETFANTSKYIRATLSSNFGNFYTVSIASLFINFLPLLPLQILLINLLTDFPMIAVATDNVDVEELKAPRTYDIKEIALLGTILGAVSTFFDFLFFALFYRISPQVLQTNWFIGSVITELLFLFSIRTKLPIFKSKPPSSILIILSLVAFLTTIVLPFTYVGHTVFSFITPSFQHVSLIILIAFTYFVITETVKVLYFRYTKINN